MAILNRQLVEMSIAKDVETAIVIDSNSNNAGVLTSNVEGGLIVDNISGTRKFNKITILNTNLLLFNAKEWVLYTDSVDFVLKTNINKVYGKLSLRDDIPTYYKVGTSRFYTTFTGNSIVISGFNSSTHTIFKVYRNGKETTDYTTNSTGIIFNTSNVFTNYCEIIYYTNSQSLTGKSCTIKYNKALPMTNVFKMDLVSEDYNLNYNEEFIEIKNSGSNLSDKKLTATTNNITFQKLIDNDTSYYDEDVMVKEFISYIQLGETFTTKLLDTSTGKYKLLVNCKLSKTPNQPFTSGGNREDISIDFEKCVDL